MELNRKNVEIVLGALKGNRLECFLVSLNYLEMSLSAGGWVAGAARGVDKGFTGIGYKIEVHEEPKWEEREKESAKAKALREARKEVNYCLARGYETPSAEMVELVIKDMSEKEKKKTPPALVRAWCALYGQKRQAVKFLDSLRKLPKITAIGLSPRTTTTFKEMNLDLDVNSIKYPEIAYRVVPKYDREGKMMMKGGMVEEGYYDKKKTYKPESCYIGYNPYVKWAKGIVHNKSRFATGRHCHACGKNIPSGRFVPVEAKDMKSGKMISLWLGCDCAKTIFGIVDEGMSKEAGGANE